MQETITSRDNEKVKYVCRLAASASFRAQEGLFFAEGLRLCRDLAGRQKPRMVFATEEFMRAHPELEELYADGIEVAGHVALKLGETKTPQGIFCLFETPEAAPEDLNDTKGVLLCENLQDPANVGAVVRSAAGLGFGGVALSRGSADVYSPKALRAAMGGVLRVPVLREADLDTLVRDLQAKGTTVYAAALSPDAVPLPALEPKGPFALMIGNEGAGLRPQTAQAADARVMIPMQGGVESLNAAAAAAILMYHFSLGAN